MALNHVFETEEVETCVADIVAQTFCCQESGFQSGRDSLPAQGRHILMKSEMEQIAVEVFFILVVEVEDI
jgi:hypothetical protein